MSNNLNYMLILHACLLWLHATCCLDNNLTEKPHIEKNKVREYTTTVGEIVEIPCRVTGRPPPKVEWSVDGKPLSSISGLDYEILVRFNVTIL